MTWESPQRLWLLLAGGQVAAYSTLGVGSTFVLWLPAADRTGDLPPPAASPWPRTGS